MKKTGLWVIYTVCNGLWAFRSATVYVTGTDAQMQRWQEAKELHKLDMTGLGITYP